MIYSLRREARLQDWELEVREMAAARGMNGRLSGMRHRSASSRHAVAVGIVMLAALDANAALAQDATWTGASFSDWNTPTNWSTGSVPTGTATFNGTTPTTIFLNSGQASVDAFAFPTGAASYTFVLGVPGNAQLEFNGSGIINNSASIPSLMLGTGTIDFNNSSSAGNAAITIAAGDPAAILRFNGSSTAGTASITNRGQLDFFGFSTAGNSAITNTFINSLFGTTTFHDRATAGNATVTNEAVLIFTDSSSAANAQITNTHVLDFQGGSTAGDATITNSAGTTSFSGASTAGSSHIGNTASLNFGDTSTAGNATITNSGSGIISFNDTSTAGSAHISDSAVLNFNGNSTAGSSTIDVVTLAGSVVFTDSSSAGSATINNAWFVMFNGASTAANANIINDSALSFNGTSSAGSATITNNTALSSTQFTNSASAGQSTIVNHGTLSFFNTSTAGSATITNETSLNFRDASSAGNANITNAQQLVFRDTSTAGNANITNNGTTSFNGSSTSGNAVITNTGALLFLDTSTGGTARLINQAGGLVDFSGSSGAGNDGRLSVGSIEGAGVFYLGGRQVTVGGNNLSTTVSGLISDCSGTIPLCQGGGVGGVLVKAGTGTLTLTGANTYTGGTVVSDGTLLLSGSGTLGASSGTTTVTGGTLDLGGTTQTQALVRLSGGTIRNGGLNAPVESSGGIIDGLGGGASLTTLAGTTTLLGVNSYSGATNVNGGILDVEGSITGTSLVSVNSGGVLTGAGIIDPLTVTIGAGGAFAPGNGTPGSSTTIIGNLALASGALYQVQIGSSTASFANVSGSATLGNATLNAVFTPGSFVTRQYTVLTAGSVSGTFGQVTSVNMPANFTTNVTYDAGHAYLNLSLAFTPPPNSGTNGNQQNVGNAVSNFFNSGGSMPLVFGALNSGGLAQVSGEIATGSQQATFNAMDLFMGLLTDPFIAGRGDPVGAGGTSARDALASIYRKAPPPAPPGFEQRWSVWAAGYGGSQSADGNAMLGSNDASRSVYGTAVGADYRISPDLLAGFAIAGGGTGFNVSGLGDGRSDLFQAGAFIRRTVGTAYLSGALAYAWQDITTDRTVTIAGIDRLRAEFDANAWSGRIEGGYRFAVLGAGLTPYAAGQFTTFDLPAYAETALSGTNMFALDYAGKSVTDSRSELGLRSDKSFAVQDGLLTLRGRLAWAHDFDPGRAMAATFQLMPGAGFIVNGASQAADSALTTASAEIKWLNGWSASATFEGEFSSVTRAYAGKGAVRYAW
jgi:autotransporter-associated beta strand protein